VTLSAGGAGRLFGVPSGVTLALANLRVEDGRTMYSGGAVANDGTLSISSCTFANNTASFGACNPGWGTGGAIYSPGTLIVESSTFSGNVAEVTGGNGVCNSGNGGAISASGRLLVTNSTFVGNAASGSATSVLATSGGDGGAIFIWGPGASVWNSTFADNSASWTGPTYGGGSYGQGAAIYGPAVLRNTILAGSTSGASCSQALTDGGNNLDFDGSCVGVATDPLLDPAGITTANGGPTPTVGLQAASPAVNAGDQSVCGAAPVNGVDQRGKLRPGTGATTCSIGAFEYAGR
jgi:hypothetical protein